MSRRTSRVEEASREVLAEVLAREVKDPRVGFVTITGVKVSPDLRHARVFVSVLGEDEEVARSMAGLESARGYMRSELGKHLRLKYLPEIEFVLEHGTEEALRLANLMREVASEMEEGGDGDDLGDG
ncbi:MAG TPA: 30S ribosome-binding factor RbfA [Candidatus Anoxymicrobiaceae bacterium]|jgi:ribosome-binding factor A